MEVGRKQIDLTDMCEEIKTEISLMKMEQSTIATMTAKYEARRDAFIKAHPELLGVRVNGHRWTLDVSSGFQKEVQQDILKKQFPEVYALVKEKAVSEFIDKFKAGVTALKGVLTQEQIEGISIEVNKAISLTFREYDNKMKPVYDALDAIASGIVNKMYRAKGLDIAPYGMKKAFLK